MPAANTAVNFTEKKAPFSATNLGELAAGVLRHGMTWTIFRPEEGVFFAQGNGHTLRLKLPPVYTFEYIPQPSIKNSVSDSLYVENPMVDKLFFGILPGDPQLELPDYDMGTIADVYRTMYRLDPSGIAVKKIRNYRHPSFAPTSLFGFSDIIALAGAMLRGYKSASTLTRLPIPAEHTTGLLSHTEGFVIFRHRLDDFIVSPQYTVSPARPVPAMVLAVRDMYYEMMDSFPEWEDEVLANKQINNRAVGFLNRSLEHWVTCTEYFKRVHATTGPAFYRDLMASHLKNAVNWWHQAWTRIRRDQEREHFGLRNYLAEGMHLYWDYLDNVIEDMESKGWMEISRENLTEAWVVMIFRGFCWWRCHWMMEGDEMCEAPPRLPKECYKDHSPIQSPDVESGFVVIPSGEDETIS
ncbi:MAG: hypothetical protein Q9176_000446 [Flavoplaca citrina]